MARPRSEFAADLRTRRRDTRRRILDAAAELIESRPWHEIALEQVMAQADLTRTAFYRHFDERSDLLIALLEESGVGDDPAGALWRESEDPVGSIRAGCEALTDLFVKHGRLLRAAAEAAVEEPAVAEVYEGFADSFVASAAARIEADRAAGRSRVADPAEVARALVWMDERYLLQTFGRRPFRTGPEVAAAALTEIWTGAVYGTRP